MPEIFDGKSKVIKIVIGYFFIVPLVILFILILVISIRSQVLFSRDKYFSYYKYGNDIRKGTMVTVNGIEAGEVYSVKLAEDNRIKVEMIIRKEFSRNIRTDSVAKIVRPLLIGNKQIFITAGSESAEVIKPGSPIESEESSELIDLVSGITLNDFLKSLDLVDPVDGERISVQELYKQVVSTLLLMNNMQTSLEDLTESMGGMNSSFGKMAEGMAALDDLSVTMGEFSASLASMQALAESLETMSESIEKMEKLSGSMDTLASDLGDMADSMEKLSKLGDQMEKMNTTLEDLGEMGEMISKLTAFIDEMSIVVQALEESVLLKSKVEKIKKRNKNK